MGVVSISLSLSLISLFLSLLTTGRPGTKVKMGGTGGEQLVTTKLTSDNDLRSCFGELNRLDVLSVQKVLQENGCAMGEIRSMHFFISLFTRREN